MDPITQGLALANTALQLATRIYDDTPQPMRQANAENWGKFIHNIGDCVVSLQDKINAAIKQ